MTVPPFITKLFSGGIGKIGESIKSIIDESKFSAEEKAEIQLKISTAINSHELEMTKLATQETEAYLKDIDSARQMQMEALRQDDVFAKRFIYFLSAGIILLTFVFDFLLLFVQYPERNHDLVNVVLGVLNSGCLISIMNFFYGSTKGSEKKNEMIEKMASK